MKFVAAILFALFVVVPASANLSRFDHIVIMVQENRTPDNLFYTLCATRLCSTHPDSSTYDIETANWLDKNAKGGVINPSPLPLATRYGPAHTHMAFVSMCDFDLANGTCRMDGAGDILCKHCPPNTPFTYVAHAIRPYLVIAKSYGWANYMFQTNQGPSFPAHQFLFGATSAPSRAADHEGTFAAENAENNNRMNGCIAPVGSTVALINAKGIEFKNIYPCFEHETLGDLLDQAKVSWRYYTPGAGHVWSAPDAIRHICRPSNGVCAGSIWRKHLALYPPEVLWDISRCALPGVSWVIPSAQYSDHAGSDTGSGPAWVATVINAIGNSGCRNGDGTPYWDSTAIVVTWDDWGGFYDHEPPTFMAYPEGGYQYGFRVPMLFVSAYTPAGYINNERLDFGSIIRFVEYNFGIPMGELTFADARSTRNLARFYDLSATPRKFRTLPSGIFNGPGGNKIEAPDDD
ncbi:MAG TPA: alkaline phosphatase family protein [Rhizomicrobium sp.]|jgi:phospholipase C|nr:alkaline phosphatase family protein [Rhizomicrobium sp.]